MITVLQALQLHGQHEANLGSLLVLRLSFMILRPLFPSVTEVCTACAFMNKIINHIHVSAILFFRLPACNPSALEEHISLKFGTYNPDHYFNKLKLIQIG
jgi:hypothetical protein